jgi:hypothetical protein
MLVMKTTSIIENANAVDGRAKNYLIDSQPAISGRWFGSRR